MPTSFLLLPFAPRWFVVDCLKGGPLVISAHVGSELINNRLRIEPPFTPCQESANKKRKAKERVCGARAVLFFFFFFFLSWRFIRMDNLIRVTFDSCLRLFSLSLVQRWFIEAHSLYFVRDARKRLAVLIFLFCFVFKKEIWRTRKNDLEKEWRHYQRDQ